MKQHESEEGAMSPLSQLISVYMRRFILCPRATSAVEFSIFAPFLFALAVFIADLSLGMYYKMRVQNAAQFGTQYAIAHGADPNSIVTAINNTSGVNNLSVTPPPFQFCGCAGASGIGAIDCTAICPGGGAPGVYLTVSTQGIYTPLIPYPLLPASYNLAMSATVRIQ